MILRESAHVVVEALRLAAAVMLDCGQSVVVVETV